MKTQDKISVTSIVTALRVSCHVNKYKELHSLTNLFVQSNPVEMAGVL